MTAPFKKKFTRTKRPDTAAEAEKYTPIWINPAAVRNLFGNYIPNLPPKVLTMMLDSPLKTVNYDGNMVVDSKGAYLSDDPAVTKVAKGLLDRLLAHNRGPKKHPWGMLPVDVDIALYIDLKEKRTTTRLMPMFANPASARPKHERLVIQHINILYADDTQWCISVPLQMLMKSWGVVKDSYFGYQHSITMLETEDDKDFWAWKRPVEEQEHGPLNQYTYLGITKRNWLERMAEHFAESRRGGNKTFHKAWREFQGRNDVQLWSELIICNHSYEGAMDWEEEQVDVQMEKGLSLNMIPGGFKGMRFLHEHRVTPHAGVTLAERESAITEYAKRHSRLGIPNLLAAELWRDDDYAAKIITGPEGRLDVEQVRAIRSLSALGVPPEVIAERIGALNTRQVERVINRETYTRIH